MKFEVFNSKFQNAVKILDRYGCTMHNEDVVDLLWNKLNNAELEMSVDSIKVNYWRYIQKYTNILQEVAIQIPTGKTPTFTTAGVTELKTGGNNNRNKSSCPEEGANLPDGNLYTGSYPYKQWVSSAVTPHHDEICAIREEGRGNQKSNDNKKGRQQKRKVFELRSQVLELESTKQRLICELVTKIDNVKSIGGGNG